MADRQRIESRWILNILISRNEDAAHTPATNKHHFPALR
jgi:hypothetical protein